ncbi:SAP domain containing ribonucleoprotein [Leptinotarsa decemlineata]|uniref:SAP domain containing ribonucleoprotein n=1 Tax=Leptinotarsa decemlineata TaxID=7539 RepID=UPI003D30D2DA
MADATLSQNSTDFTKLKVPDLKKELKLRGLSTTGNKNELIERLQKNVKTNDTIGSESVDDLEEELLNDDDDDHSEENESSILENDFDVSPKSVKRILSESSEIEGSTPVPAKKIVLTRHNSVIDPIKATEKQPEPEKSPPKEEKKIIKLSNLTAKDRLEMRAKKFGVSTLSADAKKLVRAERFGKSDNSATSITSTAVNTSVDVLKQRAQRFGSSVSTVMSGLENEEKMLKRKARFSNSSNGTTTASEKGKQRLERFKQPVK